MRVVTPNDDDDVTRETPASTPFRRRAYDLAGSVPMRRPGAGRADLEQAVAVLRARVEEEFRISERLDGKARQAFTLAAGFFVVAQTVAIGSFSHPVDGAKQVLVAVLALISGVLAASTGHRLASGEELVDEADIRPDAIVEWCDTATDDDFVTVRIVSNLRDVANVRRANNELREKRYERVALMMRLTLTFSLVELIFAILVRM
jgi:hypothetical protein